MIEITVITQPKKQMIATCNKCNTVLHTDTWGVYSEYKKKREKFSKYKVCPFCDKPKEI